MAESGGLSGVAVAVGTVGTLLIYAGIRGVNPVQALKDISSGKPVGVSKTGTTQGDTSGDYIVGTVDTNQGGAAEGAPLVQAAEQFASDKYSQASRWTPGYSDCSSFVGKALKSLGIKYPGNSTTGSYLTWSALTTIPKSQVQAGDLLVSPAHMAIATSHTTAIGQQNPQKNVQTGSISNIMYAQNWVARRFKTPIGLSSSQETAAGTVTT
jgi:cell wall-associated NlpC family hydrolase